MKIAKQKEENKELKKNLGDYSYNDLRSELQSIVQQKYGKKSQNGEYWNDYPYIVDVYEDEFVVEKDGRYYISSYSCKDGTIDIGDFFNAKKVYKQTGKEAVKTMGKTKPGSSHAVTVG